MKSHRMTLVAVLGWMAVSAGTANAFPPINPYRPGATEIQAMLDRTSDFSGGTQASTATTSNTANGIQLDINWSTGTAFVNETFTRAVRSQRFPDDNGDGDGGDLDAYDGVAWLFESDTALTIKPYSQSWDNFNFQEGSQASTGCGVGAICVPANIPTLVEIDWNTVGGSFPNADRTNVFEVGFQIFGPGLPQDGTTASSVVQISTVPEPTSLALLCLSGMTMIGLAHRKRRSTR